MRPEESNPANQGEPAGERVGYGRPPSLRASVPVNPAIRVADRKERGT